MYRQVKGDLPAMFAAEARRETRRAARDVTDQAGEFMTRQTRRHTPVRTGRTRESFEKIPVHEEAPGVFVSGVTSDYYKARWAEYGVAPHDVRSKQERADGDEPKRHPGHGGAHMVAKAAAETEAALDSITARRLRAWAQTIERLAD